MPSHPPRPHSSLAIGSGLPLSREDVSRILEGRHAGWEELTLDSELAENEEVYPVLGTETGDVLPCVVTHTARLKDLLVGLDPKPVRVFRRRRLSPRPAPAPGGKRDDRASR